MQRETNQSDSPLLYFTVLHFNSHMKPSSFYFILLAANSKYTSFATQRLMLCPSGTGVLQVASLGEDGSGSPTAKWEIS